MRRFERAVYGLLIGFVLALVVTAVAYGCDQVIPHEPVDQRDPDHLDYDSIAGLVVMTWKLPDGKVLLTYRQLLDISHGTADNPDEMTVATNPFLIIIQEAGKRDIRWIDQGGEAQCSDMEQY